MLRWRAIHHRGLAFAMALIFAATPLGGCARRLGRDHVVNDGDVDRASHVGTPIGQATVRARAFSFHPGGGWAFRVERVQARRMEEPLEVRVDRMERSMKWNFFFDGFLAKAWLDIPIGIVTAPWRAYHHQDAHGLCENILFDLVARLAGGSGRDGALYRKRYYGEERPGYFARLLHWTAWFNPFQAFGSMDYDLEVVATEELSAVMTRIDAREPLPCDAVTLIGPKGKLSAKPLGAGWWVVRIEDWLGVAAAGSPVLVVAYPTDLPGKSYSGEILVHAPNRPPEDASIALRLEDAILQSQSLQAADSASEPNRLAPTSPAGGDLFLGDEFQAPEPTP